MTDRRTTRRRRAAAPLAAPALLAALAFAAAEVAADPAAAPPAKPAPAAEAATPDTATPATPEALPVDADWRARAMAWFTAADDAGRREEMRAITRALRQPCRYCHTPDFTGYTEKRLVSQQMMALSAEHGLKCEDCHAGKTELTPLGLSSAPMWALAREKKTFCGTCHVKHARFEQLTEEGRRFEQAEWPAWKKAWQARQPPSAPAATPPAPASP